MDAVTVSVECITSGGWPSGTVLTHKVSNDGFRYDAISGATTITAEGTSQSVTVTSYAFYAIEVTTKAGSTSMAIVNVQARSST